MLVICLVAFQTSAQNIIEPPQGYTNDIGNMVAMLDDLKTRVTRNVRDLTQEQTDYLVDEDSNRIGAMIMHLAATEVYYQLYTFEGRQMNDEESLKWNTAINLGDEGRSILINKPISYYLELWSDVRAETKRLLKSKDDKWFQKKIGSMNNHWAWFHVMEHQANHMGQIVMIAKRARKV